MTITVNINNFRKIKEASFSIAPVALLVGENENGKSSIAQAVALAAAQQPLPRHIAKKDAKMLVHDGAKSGKVELGRDDVATAISWPLAECKINGQGKPVQASEFAVGLKSIFSLSNTEKVAYFISLLKANPTLDDLKVKLPKSLDHQLPDIWKQIQESGWDEAHASAKSDEADLTGQWKNATGETKWNVSSAGNWRPATWEMDLERAERTDLEVAYAEAKKELEDSLKVQGAAAFDRTQAKALVDRLPEYEKRLSDAKAELQTAETKYADLTKDLNALGYSGDEPLVCPDCGSQLMLNQERKLTQAETVDERIKERYFELGADLKTQIAEVTRLRDEVTLAQHQFTEVEKAKEKLESLGTGGATLDVEAMRTAYAKAERRLDDFNAFHKSQQLYERILTQKELVAALGQSGVRKIKLDQQITKFCEEVLKPLSVAYGCEHIWLDNDLEIWRGQRHYSLLSRSARYAVRIVLQAAIAMADRSELLVIDDIDEINDRRNRAGMMAMVTSTGIPALVCMAKRPEENAPDLSARGTGQTYSVIEGVVQPFNPPAAQEALRA